MLDEREHIRPGNVGETMVEQDEVEGAGGKGIQAGQGSGGRVHLVAGSQRGGHSFPHPGVIVHDEKMSGRYHR